MSTSLNKIIIDVKGINEKGHKMTQSFRLPTIDDWQKNLITLNKKILKTFNSHNGYALSIKKNIIAFDDYKALSDIIKHSNSGLPTIEIVSKNLLKTANPSIKNNTQQIRHIIIHYNNKQYISSLPFDIGESDTDKYNELITAIKLNFNMKDIKNVSTFKLYEKCDGKRIQINDWDDLYESLEDKKLSETLHLYLSHNISTEEKDISSDEFESQSQIESIFQSQTYLMENIKNEIIYKDRVGKLVLLGDSGVGKSSIERRFVCNKFSEFIEPTVGAMFSRRTLDYGDYRFTFEIWDTAGQDRFKSLTPLYYRNATAALIVYDITNYRSYDNALRWITEVKSYDENIVIALCGNKIDLYKKRKVSYDKVKQWVVKHNIAIFGETSAKTDMNITKMFETIGEVVVKTTVDKQSGFRIDDREYNDKNNEDEYGGCYSYCQIV
eukprot:513213_1